MDDYVAPVEKPPKKQTSILSFATECPRGSITYRPSIVRNSDVDDHTVGHLPRELSHVLWHFLNHGRHTCTVRGNWKTAALLSRSRWFGDTVLGETAWKQEDGGNS